MKRLSNFMKANTSLTVIIAAAALLELTTAVLYYAAQNIIQRTVERLVQREMDAIYLSIHNKLTKVEVTLDNMAWVVASDLSDPDSLMTATRRLVEHNPDILGSSISCIPDLYPQKGYWYEPYSVRRADGTIESMQLGGATHDYTKAEFFTVPLAEGRGHWSEPYLDSDGAKAMVTTYSLPVRDGQSQTVAVIDADISLAWLGEAINDGRVYKSTRRFLVTGAYNLLAGEDVPIFRQALGELKADADKEGYVTLRDEDGRKKHVYFAPVGGMTDWMLISVLDDGDVFSRLRRIRLSLLLPLMMGLVIVGFIVYRSSRNLERLRRVNAEKERIGGELRVASQIQQSMLPKGELSVEGLELRGSLVPAREVGGDLFDYFIRDDKLFFCIGDVSGKGVPSAMVMSVTRALFRSAADRHSNPAHIIQIVNKAICQGNESNMFVTMFAGVLDLPTGRLHYCDAGHDAPIILSEKLNALDLEPHLPVGVFDDYVYSAQETQIAPGSTIFLYTDGLTEAMDEHHRQFGLKRVREVLGACTDMQPDALLRAMTDAIDHFVKDAERQGVGDGTSGMLSDDLTMLAIRYTPKTFESKLSETLTITNRVSEVTKLTAFMKSVTKQLGIERALALKLQLAVEEAVVNVIDYAYPSGHERLQAGDGTSGMGSITVQATADDTTLRFRITDSGAAFDPTAKEKADTTLSAEDRQIGGLGILLVRELMDSINYERVNNQNILTLTKKYK